MRAGGYSITPAGVKTSRPARNANSRLAIRILHYSRAANPLDYRHRDTALPPASP
jgi:hypothetical protein